MHETGTAISNTFRSFHSSLSTEGATRSASLCSVLLYRARAASHYLATRSSWRWFHSGRIVLQALLSTPLFTVQLLPWSERPTFQRLLVRCLIISSPSFLQLQKKKVFGGGPGKCPACVSVCERERGFALVFVWMFVWVQSWKKKLTVHWCHFFLEILLSCSGFLGLCSVNDVNISVFFVQVGGRVGGCMCVCVVQ